MGAGKTYQVLNAIPSRKRYYVSLFGVQDIEQLNSEIIAAASPSLAKIQGPLSEVSTVVATRTGWSELGNLAPSVLNALCRRNVKNDRVLIFDDIERSNIKLEDLLGVVNLYVEQRGFNVVIIAHDTKIIDDFSDVKEKVVGQTIRVEPDIDAAFRHFSLMIPSQKSKDFLHKYEDVIKQVFIVLKVKSLKILRHVLEDVCRLFTCLSEQHVENNDAITEALQLHIAINIEVRSSRIKPEVLINRRRAFDTVNATERTDGTIDYSSILASNIRYPAIDLSSLILSDEVLRDMFVDGRYSSEDIGKDISSSIHFMNQGTVAPWEILINFDELEDEVVLDSLNEINRQIDEYEVVIPGEILHTFSLKLLMVQESIEEGSFDTVVESFKLYIDGLLERDKIPPQDMNLSWLDLSKSSYQGVAYWVSDSYRQHFDTMRSYLNNAKKIALENKYPEIWDQLKVIMQETPRLFLHNVAFVGGAGGLYAQTPVFSQVNPTEFVDIWLSLPKEQWKNIAMSLKLRYANDSLNGVLSEEREWALLVGRILVERAAREQGFSSIRIRRIIPEEVL